MGRATHYGDVENGSAAPTYRELNAELVDAQGLTAPEMAKFAVHDGTGAPVITDGPFPESKELPAGYRIVDVREVMSAPDLKG